MSDRFTSILRQLHLGDDLPRSLTIGCGDFPELGALQNQWPTWMHIGLDVDLPTLRRAPSLKICADGRRLPLASNFSLLVIRHPDIAKNRAAWGHIFGDVSRWLAKNGLLLVTSYDLDEIDFARESISMRHVPLDESGLAPPDLAGRDRFALVFH